MNYRMKRLAIGLVFLLSLLLSFTCGWLTYHFSQPQATTFGKVLEEAMKKSSDTIYIGPGTYSEDTPVIVVGEPRNEL